MDRETSRFLSLDFGFLHNFTAGLEQRSRIVIIHIKPIEKLVQGDVILNF